MLLSKGDKKMKLQDCTIEELKAELKRRNDLIKAERNKVKRCRMCKHWGKIDYWGKDLSGEQWEWLRRMGGTKSCIFFKTKNGKYYRCHAPLQPACEHFEEIIND